ncbi:uncharacterized protein LOC115779925 [Archocentrus centrarchus]|uniref:uncharacterized protein LOC115779925 n=1 Tax=Archocentrus centrarchus TaxID=63155 RepID=UPI0011EA1473|nr:uncharacterized protein LOC115779925 [Archocentrus centrarchus]
MELDRLIRKRRAIRGATTRLLQTMDTELNRDPADVGRLRELLANLSTKEETLRELDQGIEDAIATDDLEAEIASTEDYKERVITLRTRAQRAAQAVKKASDVVALRQLYDECEIQIRSLESLGVVSETYGSLLCPILLQLIPEEITLQYSRQRAAKRNTVKLVLENMQDSGQKIEIEAIETPQICTAVMKVPGEPIQRELERRGLQFADAPADGANDSELSVLIGADFYWSTVSGRVERLTDKLVALESVFGWSVQGPVTMSSVTEAACMHVRIEEEALISSQLKAFWEVDSLGIIKHEPSDPDEDNALQMFGKTTQFKDGRYEVELPWRHENPELPDNYQIAKKRFEGLKRKLRADVIFYKRYSEVIEDYLQQGIVEEVTDDECLSPTVKYYLPHHAVLREDKMTTKLRVVFDASSHEDGCPSLNNCLLTGPNLNPDLLGILVRFRLHKIAFMADIKKAFLQISLAQKDRDAVRFLWLTASPREEADERLRVLRMTRVVFGVSSSPFLLAAVVRRHLQQYKEHPHPVQLITESLYVDDFVASVRDIEEALSVTTEAKKIMAAAGMDLCKWMTNSPALKERWRKTVIGPIEEPDAHGTVLKVLGLVWRTQTDDFVFDLRPLLEKLTISGTKRNVLQHAASIFDPLGFLTPFTIRVKCLLQEMWERGLSWDEKLPPDLNGQWRNWRSELPLIHQIAIPRWYGERNEQSDKTLTLHVFCDASEKAYSAVAYLQWEGEDRKMASLVASKSRVAPLKKLSLPHLELMGALIGARLGRNLINLLKMELCQLHLWTDSMIVLHWIRSSAHKWKQFVANRVVEIQSLTDPAAWSHCKGKENPADLPTRGLSVTSLSQSQLWWRGPAFLTSSESEADCADQSVNDNSAEEELEVSEQVTVHLSTENNKAVEAVLDLQRYSKLKTVLRVTAWLKRFTDNTRLATKRKGELTAEELFQPEKYWIKLTQHQDFSQELNLMKDGKSTNKDSKIRELRPFFDEDGLMEKAHFSAIKTAFCCQRDSTE